ncbi:DUF2971 domain-containing protein [Leptospira sp. 2 VSF19]|uniref:DUF2971 domain-containing protein n=1 Tax=Leptospira soteropolitanensis TaxID=2950025 RepID=A0AAW5VE43_9LEPT|nr:MULTISPECIES: DUF2971 domain-containing protein [Leptospira]PKA26785.1 hypothetical protein CH381_08455 [Leptospira sp. mixed culture ATI2-C-A1]MCW7493560.1 DUF2971 domain-containing protein [Leptospira soteropolitanensis]MCW7500909.1 DUF2971 domain-containing protein [Leptospira soteropolitanensis]MCW7523411.1 DUF2971 domain-containing protein [Leptospira soteropolitanensis]MCW7527272.1 DUF2971 domain-containing protein [Leptospira soteropolitanensis]
MDRFESYSENILKGKNENLLFRFEKNEEKRLNSVLDSKLFFSGIGKFNDPYEFTHFPIAKTSSNLLSFKKSMEDAGISLEGIDWKSFLLQKNDDSEFLKENMTALSKEYSIVCFSKVWDNHLLWSHYANAHKGLCYAYGFDSGITADMRSIVEVGNIYQATLFDIIYTNVWPEYLRDHEEFSRRILYTKSLVWEYEKEVRLILRKERGLQTIKKESLRALIFGMKFDPDLIDPIIKQFQDRGYKIEFYIIKMKLGSYELGLEKI